jgi:hypothetical protein
MKLLLEREPSHLTCTLGSLYVNDEFECFTLEDVVREIPGVPVERWKIKGKTAIPAGTYKLGVTFSQRFQRMLPILHDVPGFDGVRIHTGNTDADTEGCILVGTQLAEAESITYSRAAFNALYPKLVDALGAGEDLTIEIRNGTP